MTKDQLPCHIIIWTIFLDSDYLLNLLDMYNVTRWMQKMEQELISLPEHPSSTLGSWLLFMLLVFRFSVQYLWMVFSHFSFLPCFCRFLSDCNYHLNLRRTINQISLFFYSLFICLLCNCFLLLIFIIMCIHKNIMKIRMYDVKNQPDAIKKSQPHIAVFYHSLEVTSNLMVYRCFIWLEIGGAWVFSTKFQ
jgi:hypothetical protein